MLPGPQEPTAKGFVKGKGKVESNKGSSPPSRRRGEKEKGKDDYLGSVTGGTGGTMHAISAGKQRLGV